MLFNPSVKITSYHDSILNPDYYVDFFKQFDIVMNALDNRGKIFTNILTDYLKEEAYNVYRIPSQALWYASDYQMRKSLGLV